MSKAKKRGRPTGSKTQKVPVQVVNYHPPVCPACKEKDSSKVINVLRTLETNGQKRIWRNMICDCGQRWRQIAVECVNQN